MQRDKRKVEAGLCSKGFRIDETHHHYFIYYTIDGRRSLVRTRTSHGSGKTIDDSLIAHMARQCRLRKNEFIDLIDCPLSREAYESRLREGGAM